MIRLFFKLPTPKMKWEINSYSCRDFEYLYGTITFDSCQDNVLTPVPNRINHDIISWKKTVYLPVCMDNDMYITLISSLPIHIRASKNDLRYVVSDYFSSIRGKSDIRYVNLFWDDGTSEVVDLSTIYNYDRCDNKQYALAYAKDQFTLLLSEDFFTKRIQTKSLALDSETGIPTFPETIKYVGDTLSISTLLCSNFYSKKYLYPRQNPAENSIPDKYTRITRTYCITYEDIMIKYTSDSIQKKLLIYYVIGVSKIKKRITYRLICSCTDGEWDVPSPPERAINVWERCISREGIIKKHFPSFLDYALGKYFSKRLPSS